MHVKCKESAISIIHDAQVYKFYQDPLKLTEVVPYKTFLQ